MTAFLFIPSTTGTALGRRVDFTKIAGMFGEVEEPDTRRDRRQLARLAVLALILLGVIGDTVLVSRPDALTGAALAPPAASHAPAARATAL